ncbi:MAG: hypothetical protein J0H39_18920 [Alphaproteobacteria bacterium]|nr:hypothetical protein [Alphaproteobacteria bacterium]
MTAIPALAAEALENLLGAALGVAKDDDVAVLVEPAGERHYDPRVTAWLITAIDARGAKARIVETAPDADPDDMPANVSQALTAADHAIFLSRFGDRIRFKDLPGKASRTMCYLLDAADLETPFARVPYGFQKDAHQAFLNAIAGARKATLVCPAGSALEFDFAGGLDVSRFANFTVLNFPVMIFPALSARAASGTLALTHALTSTYTHPYPDDVQPLSGTVEVTIANGAIAAFGGAQGAHVEKHFARVGAHFGVDPLTVDSWHAGINPGTAFRGKALDDIHRWASVAFGSPRYAHFHMCGRGPGEICGQVFDPTIAFDGREFWRDGEFVFLAAPEMTPIYERHGVDPAIFAGKADIGVPGLRPAAA